MRQIEAFHMRQRVLETWAQSVRTLDAPIQPPHRKFRTCRNTFARPAGDRTDQGLRDTQCGGEYLTINGLDHALTVSPDHDDCEGNRPDEDPCQRHNACGHRGFVAQMLARAPAPNRGPKATGTETTACAVGRTGSHSRNVNGGTSSPIRSDGARGSPRCARIPSRNVKVRTDRGERRSARHYAQCNSFT
jgi:hypothetical protein